MLTAKPHALSVQRSSLRVKVSLLHQFITPLRSAKATSPVGVRPSAQSSQQPQKEVASTPSSRTASNHDSSSRNWEDFPINIHSRHGEASEELQAHVRESLHKLLLGKLRGGEYIEGEGGVSEVDVKLMPTEAHIEVHPRQTNTKMHDTFLRQGALKAQGNDQQGSGEAGMRSSFALALTQLENKLKKASKALPRKQDFRGTGRSH